MMRRPPTRIGATLPVPPMPSLNPGTTPLSGNDVAWPRDHDESNTLPFLYSAPVYCTVTVEFGVAAWPVPTTRSRHCSAFAVRDECDVSVTAFFRFVAPLIVTPAKRTVFALLAGFRHAFGAGPAGTDGDGELGTADVGGALGVGVRPCVGGAVGLLPAAGAEPPPFVYTAMIVITAATSTSVPMIEVMSVARRRAVSRSRRCSS